MAWLRPIRRAFSLPEQAFPGGLSPNYVIYFLDNAAILRKVNMRCDKAFPFCNLFSWQQKVR
jgi:hypothetical protein